MRTLNCIRMHSTMHYPADCACSRVHFYALYLAAHAKHSTLCRVPLYPLPSTRLYTVEGRGFTPQVKVRVLGRGAALGSWLFRPAGGLKTNAPHVDTIKYTAHTYTVHATPGRGSSKFGAGADWAPAPLIYASAYSGIGVAACRVSVHAPRHERQHRRRARPLLRLRLRLRHRRRQRQRHGTELTNSPQQPRSR